MSTPIGAAPSCSSTRCSCRSATTSTGPDNSASNVEAARNAGVNLAFFSGNEVFWKTRWETAIDGSGTPYRTLVTYKETHANQVIDPATPTWTGTWRDPRFSPPGDGGRPENALTGQMFTVNCCAINMVVGAADGDMRFWRSTPVAALTGSQTRQVGTNTVGYEWDEDVDNGFRPAGSFRVSETDASGEVIQDYGSTYGFGTATHSMTMYRASSGALVFGAGTVQWAWGLDSQHDRGSAAADVAAQQATLNLLADMGVQPGTIRPGLVAQAASTDTIAPTSIITSPANGASIPPASNVTVTGTATDGGGGQVAGVEVSVDGGTSWHRAEGRGIVDVHVPVARHGQRHDQVAGRRRQRSHRDSFGRCDGHVRWTRHVSVFDLAGDDGAGFDGFGYVSG